METETRREPRLFRSSEDLAQARLEHQMARPGGNVSGVWMDLPDEHAQPACVACGARMSGRSTRRSRREVRHARKG